MPHSIDDAKKDKPRMRGFIHGTGVIIREKGVRGFFQGFVPTTARQAANSAVRFGSYTSMKQVAQSYVAPGEKLGALSTFGLGAVAGTITVYDLTYLLHFFQRTNKDKVHDDANRYRQNADAVPRCPQGIQEQL
jgi:hypothetical protein